MITRRLFQTTLLLCAFVPLPGNRLFAFIESESYYLMVLAYQGIPNRGKDSHTFASFVKVITRDKDGVRSREANVHTISWLPERIKLRLYKLLPEIGRNFSLEETLAIAREGGLRVSMWGPYEIKKDLYDRSLMQFHKLEAGKLLYKSIDMAYPTVWVSNCIHAVSDLVWMPPRLRVWTPAYGDTASYRVLITFLCYLKKPRVEQDWVLELIGLDTTDIVRRDIRDWKAWFPKFR